MYKDKEILQVNVLALAYVGDAVIDLYVRRHLVNQGIVKPKQLHQKAIQFVSAKAQASFLIHLNEGLQLTDDEVSMVRRGRNAKSGSTPKNTNVQTYRYSTAFEALIGYLHLTEKEDRVSELLQALVEFHT